MIFEAGPSWRSQRNPSFLIRDSSPDIDCCLWGAPRGQASLDFISGTPPLQGVWGAAHAPHCPP